MELDQFKRKLIRTVSAAIHEEKKSIDEVWEQLNLETKKDCKKLWERMRTITLKKISRILLAEDRVAKIPPIARMNYTDWLMFDLILVHEDIDCIGLERLESGQDSKSLDDLMSLVEEHGLETLEGSALADGWAAATVHYNRCGRQCSPMLLQKRWYQLKAATRKRFYVYWSRVRGDVKRLEQAKMYKPTDLQIRIAKKYPSTVCELSEKWNELIEKQLVILPQIFEAKMREKNRIEISEDTPSDVAVVNTGMQQDLYPSTDILDDEKHSKIIDANKSIPEPIALSNDEDIITLPNNSDTLKKLKSVSEVLEPLSLISDLNQTLIDIETNEYIDMENSCLESNLGKEPVTSPSNKSSGANSTIPISDTNIQSILEIEKVDEIDLENCKVVNKVVKTTAKSNILRPSSDESNEDCAKSENISLKKGSEITESTSELNNVIVDRHKKTDLSLILNEEKNELMRCQETNRKNIALFNFVHIDSSDHSHQSETKLDIAAYNEKAQTFDEMRLKGSTDAEAIIPPSNVTKPQDTDDTIIVEDDEQSQNIVESISKDSIKLPDKLLDSVQIFQCASDMESNIFINGMEFIDDGIEVENEDVNYSDKKNDVTYDFDASKENLKSFHCTNSLQDVDMNRLKCAGHIADYSNLVNMEKNMRFHKFDTQNDLHISNNNTNDSELKIDEHFIVKTTSYLLQKPRVTSYNPIQLCKNPDFNTKLRRLNIGFYGSPRNLLLLKSCKPLTIDLHKAFEEKLVNNVLYLESDKKCSNKFKNEGGGKTFDMFTPIGPIVSKFHTKVYDSAPKKYLNSDNYANIHETQNISSLSVIPDTMQYTDYKNNTLDTYTKLNNSDVNHIVENNSECKKPYDQIKFNNLVFQFKPNEITQNPNSVTSIARETVGEPTSVQCRELSDRVASDKNIPDKLNVENEMPININLIQQTICPNAKQNLVKEQKKMKCKLKNKKQSAKSVVSPWYYYTKKLVTVGVESDILITVDTLNKILHMLRSEANENEPLLVKKKTNSVNTPKEQHTSKLVIKSKHKEERKSILDTQSKSHDKVQSNITGQSIHQDGANTNLRQPNNQHKRKSKLNQVKKRYDTKSSNLTKKKSFENRASQSPNTNSIHKNRCQTSLNWSRFCCWCRGRYFALVNEKKFRWAHTCTFNSCICCCRNFLENKVLELIENSLTKKRHHNKSINLASDMTLYVWLKHISDRQRIKKKKLLVDSIDISQDTENESECSDNTENIDTCPERVNTNSLNEVSLQVLYPVPPLNITSNNNSLSKILQIEPIISQNINQISINKQSPQLFLENQDINKASDIIINGINLETFLSDQTSLQMLSEKCPVPLGKNKILLATTLDKITTSWSLSVGGVPYLLDGRKSPTDEDVYLGITKTEFLGKFQLPDVDNDSNEKYTYNNLVSSPLILKQKESGCTTAQSTESTAPADDQNLKSAGNELSRKNWAEYKSNENNYLEGVKNNTSDVLNASSNTNTNDLALNTAKIKSCVASDTRNVEENSDDKEQSKPIIGSGDALTKKNILTDLMEMSGISLEDTETTKQNAEVDPSNYVSQTDAIVPQNSNVIKLSTISSLKELKQAFDNHSCFLKLDLVSGYIVPITININTMSKSKFGLTSECIDLTNDLESLENCNNLLIRNELQISTDNLLSNSDTFESTKNTTFMSSCKNIFKDTHKRKKRKLTRVSKSRDEKINIDSNSFDTSDEEPLSYKCKKLSYVNLSNKDVLAKNNRQEDCYNEVSLDINLKSQIINTLSSVNAQNDESTTELDSIDADPMLSEFNENSKSDTEKNEESILGF